MPPRNKWPPGVQPPPLPKSILDNVTEGGPEADGGAGKKSPEQATSEVCFRKLNPDFAYPLPFKRFPLFDLTEFLNAKSKSQL